MRAMFREGFILFTLAGASAVAGAEAPRYFTSAEDAVQTANNLLAAPVSDAPWQARGADAILIYRPALRGRAETEMPPAGAANLPALVQAIKRLQSLAASKRGNTRAGVPPLEPEKVHEPTDEELLLSLAGDRLRRTVQQTSQWVLAAIRRSNKAFMPLELEYPHIEIRRVENAGSWSHYVALPPVARYVIFENFFI